MRLVTLGLFIVGSSSMAAAQVPLVPVGQAADSAVSTPAPSAAAPAAPAAPQRPVIIPIGADGRPIMEDVPAADTGFYYDDEDVGPEQQEPFEGQTPELHVVRTGDTLWDICAYYFNDSWQWPKVWSYNTKIANPHLIYPGDGVRLLPEGVAGAAAVDGGEATSPTAPSTASDVSSIAASTPGLPSRKVSVTLRQTAFVSEEELKTSMTVVGSNDDKTLMVTNDEVYLKYDAAEPPTAGARYSIYEVATNVKHPKTGKKVGAYVTIIGDIEITSVHQDKHARAILRRTTGAIERGAKVGPLARQYKTVEPIAAKVDAQGIIVAMFTQQELIGYGDVVFLDVGTDTGVEVGNRMYVIRRGDMLRKDLNHAGINDKKYPARAIGQIVVVETGRDFSVGVVTLAMEEMGINDIVTTQTGQ